MEQIFTFLFVGWLFLLAFCGLLVFGSIEIIKALKSSKTVEGDGPPPLTHDPDVEHRVSGEIQADPSIQIASTEIQTSIHEELKTKLSHYEGELERNRRVIYSIENPEIRNGLVEVFKTANAIFKNFKEDPDDIKYSQLFLVQMERLLKLIETYSFLTTADIRREVLTDNDVEDIIRMLSKLNTQLKMTFKNLQQNNLRDLRTQTGILEKMLDMHVTKADE